MNRVFLHCVVVGCAVVVGIDFVDDDVNVIDVRVAVL